MIFRASAAPEGKLGLVTQFCAVLAIATFVAFIASTTGFLTPLNLIWMVGMPVAIAIAANRTPEGRITMGALNVLAACFGPELVAHSFGYCLQ